MTEFRVSRRVGEVADRLHRLRTLKVQSKLWCGGAFLGLLLALGNWWSPAALLTAPLTILSGVLLFVISLIPSRQRSPDLHEAAIVIEKRWPSLNSRLVTAVDQCPNDDDGGFRFLQHELISETLLHAHRNDWAETVPLWTLTKAKLQQIGSLLSFAAAFAAAARIAHERPAMQYGSPFAETTRRGSAKYAETVEPGDASIERGTSLLVIARFAERMPGDVMLHATDAAGTTTSLPLSRSLDDPLFGGRIPSVETDLSYHVTFDRHQSDAYRVEVFDFPRLERADATILHPEYTGLGEKTIEDVRRVSVIEGSRLTLTFEFNKPVDQAVLRADDSTELELALASDSSKTERSVTIAPVENQTFTLALADAEGRSNKHPPEFVIDVIPNQPPELAIAFPRKDVRVSPLEEMSLEANVQDDFGLREYGVVYQLPDGDEQSHKLGEGGDANAEVVLAHQFAMEDIDAQPNELVAYYFYADDIGPSGGSRRTFSDMYFAEIRHFDEEYRQANSSQGQQGGMPGGNTPSSQLLQMQRDIVSATWNLIRREWKEFPSDEFPEDAHTVADSQQEAIGMGQELRSQQEDVLAQQFLDEALEHMGVAAEFLSNAAEAPSAEPLTNARRAANDTYRALVKLQVREHLVQQQSQSQSSSQSSGKQNDLNRQLQQLELENNRNRYETEQQDQAPADREQLQVLNRLRDLARRQEGLNEKIKELENALRAAQSDDEREEIERQLKRLQEEQQQMLRDLDELQERMNDEQNRSRMADARQQAQDVRENLRRTSEALKEGQMSRALAAGTRAERELNEMKDELREKTAGQFADTMRKLRQDARELAEHQQQLAEDLAGGKQEEDSGRPQLKDDESEDLDDAFTEQQERLSELMDNLKDVIEEAESNEPLLSKSLYDAVRNTRRDRPEQSLEMASRFLRHRLDQEAVRAEAQAREGIENLRDGIEEAAENVLGNEVESLRRTQREIDHLSRAIGSELAQAGSQAAEAEPQRPLDRPSDQSPNAGGRPEEQDAEDASSGRPSRQNAPQQSSEQQSSSSNQRSGQPSQSPGASGEQSEQSRPGQNSDQPTGQSSPNSGGRSTNNSQQDALSGFLTSGGQDDPGGRRRGGGLNRPLTGTDFTQWSDRMRDVEEMVDDPDLRARVAQIRDRAKEVRKGIRRSDAPNWDLVRMSIYGPMLELRDRLAEEIARREPTDDVVPLDRDPVPDRYVELVEQYYERLGSGR